MPGFHDVFLSREFKTIRDDLVKRFSPSGGIQHRQLGYGVFSATPVRLNSSSINDIGENIHDSVLYNGIDAGQGTRPVPGVNSLLENSIFKDQFYLLSSEHSLPLIRARTGEAARVEFGVSHRNSGNLLPIKHTSRTMKAPYHEIVRLLDSIRYTQEEIEIVKDRIVEDQGVLFPAVGTSEFPDPKIGDLISPMTKDKNLEVEGQYLGHGGKWGIIFIMDFLNKMHASSELYKVFYGSVATKARVTITANDLVATVQNFIAAETNQITGARSEMLTKWKVTDVKMRQGVTVFTDLSGLGYRRKIPNADIKLHSGDEIFVDLVEGVGEGQIWIRLSDYQVRVEEENPALMELIKAGKRAGQRQYSVWVKPITQKGRPDLEQDMKFGQVSRNILDDGTVMEERGMRGGAGTTSGAAAAGAAEAEAADQDVVAAPGAAPGAAAEAAGPDVVAASAAPVAGTAGAAAGPDVVAASPSPAGAGAAAGAAGATGATAFETPGEETKRKAQERATRFLNSAKFSGLFDILKLAVELLGQHLLRMCKNTNKADSKMRAHGAHGIATALAITGGALAIGTGGSFGALAIGSAVAGTASAGVGTASAMASDLSTDALQAKADAHMQCIYRLMEMISMILVFIPNLNLAAYDDDEADGKKYKEAKKNLFQHMVRIINLVGTTPEGLLGRDYQMGGWERGAADYFAKCGVEICENPINDMGKKSNTLKQLLKSRRGVEQSNLKLKENTASIEGNKSEILEIKQEMDRNMAGRASPAQSYTSAATEVSDVDDVFRELAGESRYSRQPEPEFEPVSPAGAATPGPSAIQTTAGAATPGSALQAPTVATTLGDPYPPGDDALGDPDPTAMAATPGAATPGAALQASDGTPKKRGSWV
jgi:hypothetical protein